MTKAAVLKNLYKFHSNGDIKEIVKIIEELSMDIAQENAGKTGKQSAILKRMFKQNTTREPAANVNGDKYFLLNGYYGFLLNSNCGYAEVADGLNFEKIQPTGEFESIEVDRKKLLAEKAKTPRGKAPTYILNYGDNKRIGVDPHFLVGVLDMMKNNTIKIYGELTPILVEGENGEKAMLCPRKIKN